MCTTERLIDKNSCHFIHKMSFVTLNICTCTICMYVQVHVHVPGMEREMETGKWERGREGGWGREEEGGRVGERGGEGVDREAIFL